MPLKLTNLKPSQQGLRFSVFFSEPPISGGLMPTQTPIPPGSYNSALHWMKLDAGATKGI